MEKDENIFGWVSFDEQSRIIATTLLLVIVFSISNVVFICIRLYPFSQRLFFAMLALLLIVVIGAPVLLLPLLRFGKGYAVYNSQSVSTSEAIRLVDEFLKDQRVEYKRLGSTRKIVIGVIDEIFEIIDYPETYIKIQGYKRPQLTKIWLGKLSEANKTFIEDIQLKLNDSFRS